MLGYRIQLPHAILGIIRKLTSVLPRICCCTHCRDMSLVRHCVVWSDYSPKVRPHLSKEYREEIDLGDGVAKWWIERNIELLKQLSRTLRMISPHEYARGPEVSEIMKNKEEIELLFQAWCGVALNEGIIGEGGMVHKDATDYLMNCAVLWNEFTSRDVVLMEAV